MCTSFSACVGFFPDSRYVFTDFNVKFNSIACLFLLVALFFNREFPFEIECACAILFIFKTSKIKLYDFAQFIDFFSISWHTVKKTLRFVIHSKTRVKITWARSPDTNLLWLRIQNEQKIAIITAIKRIVVCGFFCKFYHIVSCTRFANFFVISIV